MTEYYFLGNLLAPLALDREPDISIRQLKEAASLNLHHADQRQLRLFLTWIDLQNLSSLWSGHNMTILGNWTKEELIDLQKFPLAAPPFLESYLYKYKSDAEKIAHFDELLIAYFSYAYEQATGFLKEYLQYEEVVKVALAARRGQKSFLLDLFDPWQAELLAVAEGKPDIAGLLENVQEALDLYDSQLTSPLELFKQLLLVKFAKIEQFKGHYSPFSVDAVIAYAAELDLVHRWQAVTKRNK